MDEYREKLKLTNRITAVCACVLYLVCALGAMAEAGMIPLNPLVGDPHWQSRWRGFLSGATMGIASLMLYFCVRTAAALKDDKKLRKLYIKAHDEREIQLVTAARSAAMQTGLLVGIVAVIVAGYFSIAICLTILACLLALCLLMYGFYFYYRRKY